MKLPFVTPPGRIVRGSPTFKSEEYQGQKKDKPQWFFALAIPKADPMVQQFVNMLYNHGLAEYRDVPHVAAEAAKWLQGRFKWKIEDGDEGKNSQREGYRGNFIVKFTTYIGVPTCIDVANVPINPETIKCGYYVDVSGSVEKNGNTDDQAGIYMNVNFVRLLGYGPEIISSQTPEQAFTGFPPVLPPGASATPLAPAHSQPQQQAPAGYPQQQAYQQPPQQQAYQPQQQAYQPQQQQAYQPQQQAQQPQQAPMAPGFTGMFPPAAASGQAAPAHGTGAPAPSAAQAGYPGATAYPSNATPRPNYGG